jgi:Flp pilus assembly protein TadG
MYAVSRHLRSFTRTWAHFARARGGNVAITFAFALLPMLAFVGAAVDYSRANILKSELQTALDASALMVSKNASSMDSSTLQTTAEDSFKALFTRSDAKNIRLSATYSSTGGSRVVLTASANMDAVFAGILGYKTFTVSATSTTKWGNTRLRVALVLDNTGSMSSSGKMTALQTATKNLLTQLQSAASVNGDVYVSIIPFSKDVNVGSSNYAESWIDWTEWDTANRTCSGWKWGSTCYGTWGSADRSTWNGCISDRGDSSAPSSQNYDQNATEPQTGVSASLYPADQDSSCPHQMMGLSYDWTSMSSLVDAMTPGGYTNQPIGLVWGWQSLVGGGPLTAPVKDSNYTYDDVIILLSDGLNTQDRWYSSQSSVDNRMYGSSGNGTCANIKAAGVTIYTIQVNTGGDPTSTLLQNCASSSDKFFLLTSADEIVTTFNQIGTNLTRLRVAQ